MKLIKYLSYLLLAVSAVIIIIFYVSSGSDAMVSVILNWAYILLGLCILGAVVLPVFFSNGKGVKGTLIKVGAFAVVALLAYLCASSAPLDLPMNPEPSASDLKFADTAILLTAILLVVGFLAIIAGGLVNTFRNR